MTFVDTSNSMADLVVGINNELGGYFGAFIMLMTFLIMLIANSKLNTEKGFIVSSGVTSLVAALLWGMGVISFGYIFFPIAALFGGIIYYKLGG